MNKQFRKFNTNFKKTLYLCLLASLVSCVVDKSQIDVNLKKKRESISQRSVSSVQIINHQLIINGSGLSGVTAVAVNENSSNQNFSIESNTSNKIIANSISAFSFDVSKAFKLILSDANASATFQIDFSLCNALLNNAGFDCSAAVQDNDVLTYDQATNTWIPRALNGLSYQGLWDASTALPAATLSGQYYIVSVASGAYDVGDWIVWKSGTSSYDHINYGAAGVGVATVFGRTGAIVATEGDYNLDLLTDVDLTIPPVSGQVLKFNGTEWIAANDISGGGGGGGGAGSVTTTELADGSVTNAKVSATAAIDYSKLNIPNTSIPYAKLNIANGDIPAAKITGLPVLSSILAASITDADTTHAPDGNSVFDALAGKIGTAGGTLTVGTINGIPTPVNPSDVSNKAYVDSQDVFKVAKAGDTMSGILTLDSDLKVKGGSNYVTLRGHATSAAYNLILPINAGTSGYVLSTDGSGNTSWIDVTSAVTALDTDDVTEATNLYFTEARVLGTDLAGLNTGVAGPIAATDTVLSAMGKIQYQVTDLKTYGQWTKTVNDIAYSAGNVSIDKKMRFKDSGTNYVEILAPTTLAATYTLTLPTTDGTANQILKTDGAGVLSWADESAGGGGITTLTGDVTATGTGSVAATVAQVGGVTAANIAAGANLANAATNANTVSTIVKRDASGNFTAGTITATLTGTATNVSGTVAVANGGTGATTLATNRLLYGNGTSAVNTLPIVTTPSVLLSTITTGEPVWTTSTAGNVLKGSASGVVFGPLVTGDLPSGTITGSGTANYIPYYSAASTLANSPMAISGTNVSVGSASPGTNTKFNVEGQIRAKSFSQATGAIDWVNGNSGTTSFDCGTNITFANLRDGGSYSLAVTGTGTTQCTFTTAVTGDDAATVTYRFMPANTTRVASSHTIYSMQRIGTIVYVSWITGF